ncbi:MAG: NapC/NirT family cytochrome c [Deltaproteobacteria bacterium]|nr:NapC/NirT family cytochrome c [Deltaproteobacteria bacterium]MBW2306377.1 NapC/NirT family cytochrome c [Deltaproteobacteria bacterium]
MYRAMRDFLTASLQAVSSGYQKHRKGFWAFSGICFVLFIIMGAFAYKISETPAFCSLCHNMKPYVDSWKVSSHNMVTCVACHYKPGFLNHLRGKWTDGQVSLVYFVTGKTPGKFHAEISDESCLQCHPREKLKDDRIFKSVRFSHSNHLEQLRRGKKLRCTTCHGQIVQGKHLTVSESDCFICHFKPEEDKAEAPHELYLSRCTLCHKDLPEEIYIQGRKFYHGRYVGYGIQCQVCHVDIVQGDGKADWKKCVECHSEPERLETRYTSDILHRNHVTERKVECYRCHQEIQHRMIKAPTLVNFEQSCLVCHARRQHMGPREMYRGTGGIDVDDQPSRMYLANVDCASCHMHQETHPGTDLFSEDGLRMDMGQACIRCHGPGYDRMLQRWKEVMARLENDTSQRIYSAQQALYGVKQEEKSRAGYRYAQRLLSEARFNFSFVLNGRGHHNIDYALRLLTIANRKAEEAKSLIIAGYVPENITLVEANCTSLCHADAETKVVKLRQAAFPHADHVQDSGMACMECHGGGQDHGITYFKNCNTCHHGEGAGEVSCQDCHTEVADIFAGKSGIGVKEIPSAMMDTMNCTDCHTQVVEGEPTTLKGIAGTCDECHPEQNYSRLVMQWRKEAAGFLGGMEEELKTASALVERASIKKINTIQSRNLLIRAEQNMKLLGGFNGLHNIEYAKALAKATRDLIQEAVRQIPKR